MQKPVSLAPLPPSARLWSPSSSRRPIRLPFVPETVNARIEVLADPARIAAGYLLMPVLISALMASHLQKAGFVHPGIHGDFGSAVIFNVTWAIGIMVLHRLVTRKIWIGFLLFMALYSSIAYSIPWSDTLLWLYLIFIILTFTVYSRA